MDKLSCPICLELLQAPVTVPCGHSFCLLCIQEYWDGRGGGDPMCPQCRQVFSPRPVLVKNTVIAELVEEQKTAEPNKALNNPQYIPCDFCVTFLNAEKSCLQCLVSLCQDHVQPHYEVSALKRHKLVHVTENLENSICSQHNEVMKVYCRTDQQSICYLCSLDQHQEHTVVTAVAEVAEKLKEVALRREEIQQQIQEAESNAGVLVDALCVITSSAGKALSQSEKIISDVKKHIRNRHKTEMDHVKALQEKLQKQIQELTQKDQDLEKLSQTHNHIHFLNSFSSLSTEQLRPSQINLSPPPHFSNEMTAAVSQAAAQIKDATTGQWNTILLQCPGTGDTRPKTREDMLKYSCNITIDSCTKHSNLYGCYSNQYSVRFTGSLHEKTNHPDSFQDFSQVLCGQSLNSRCYWEVEWSGEVFIAVSYKSISRRGAQSAFGHNDKSWALRCSAYAYEFIHRSIRTPVPDPDSNIIGVYVDRNTGILCFYAVKDKDLVLLHQVQTLFSQPLCPGFGVYNGYADIITRKIANEGKTAIDSDDVG